MFLAICKQKKNLKLSVVRVNRDLTHLGLVVVLYGHGDHIDADDEGDKKVQVMVSAQCVDVEPDW